MSWRARVYGSASGRVFATLQDEAFDVFDDDVGKLPPTPVELEQSNVEAMDDGTLVAIEPCGVQGWRWQPDAR